MRPLKVALLCNYLADYSGNFIDSLLSIERAALADKTPYESIFVFPEHNKKIDWIDELQLNHKVYFIPTKSKIAATRAIYNICRKEKVDIVHGHFFGFGELMLVGVLTNIKTIYHFHNPYRVSPNRIKEAIKHFFQYISVDKMIGCSKAMMDTIVAAGIPARKCAFVTNRINFSRLDTTVNDRPFDATKNNLLIFGTHFIRKGCDLTLKAIEPIAEKYNIILNIVSHNREQTKKEVVEVLGYEPAWINYPPTTNNISDYYRNSQIFLTPSRSEGLSYAVIEACYCGCPLIKSDVPSMHYGLDNEDFVTIPLEVEALRKKIVEILSMDSDSRREMIESFRNQAIEKFSISVWGAEILEIYKDVVKQ